MNPEAKYSPRALQMPRSAARQLAWFLSLLALLAASPLCSAQPVQDPVAAVKALAGQGLDQADFAAAVADLVKNDPDAADNILAEAVKDEPKYACAVVKAGILALQPATGNGTLDPKVVASVVVTIVEAIQATNPDLVQQIISCALAVDNDAGLAILNALAGLYTSPNGPNRPPGTYGGAPQTLPPVTRVKSM